jgi:hypothetical protein
MFVGVCARADKFEWGPTLVGGPFLLACCLGCALFEEQDATPRGRSPTISTSLLAALGWWAQTGHFSPAEGT